MATDNRNTGSNTGNQPGQDTDKQRRESTGNNPNTGNQGNQGALNQNTGNQDADNQNIDNQPNIGKQSNMGNRPNTGNQSNMGSQSNTGNQSNTGRQSDFDDQNSGNNPRTEPGIQSDSGPRGNQSGKEDLRNRDVEKNPYEITGNWGKQSTQLKQQYSQLTDEDLKFEPGKEDELLGRIGNRLNKSRDEVIDIINRYEV